MQPRHTDYWMNDAPMIARAEPFSVVFVGSGAGAAGAGTGSGFDSPPHGVEPQFEQA